jgi:type IV pilus assembly protein PilC
MSDILILDNDSQEHESDKKTSKQESQLAPQTFIEKINTYLLSMQKIKTKDKVLIYRLLATMTNAWMSVLKSVVVLERQEKNQAVKTILWTFIDGLRSGQNLSECMEKYPTSFAEAEVGIIRSWEKTGKLNHALLELSSQIEKVESISWKLKSAMMYPMFIIMVVVWVVVVMMVVVVPKLLEIFSGGDTVLPASTQLLIMISDFFRDFWLAQIIFIVWFVIFVTIWKKTPTGHYIFDNIMLHIPIFWEINSKLILSKFSRVFSSLLWSGVSVVESLRITAVASWNEVYKQRILLLSNDVQQGIKIWESLDGDKLFPDMMIQMIQVWEQTAKLDQTVIKVADFYDEQVDNTISIINKLLEPFIIVTLAVIVWFIAVAIMQPIMNMADTITQ